MPSVDGKKIIVHVIESLRRGGAEIRLCQDIRNLPEFKHIVCYFFERKDGYDKEFILAGAELYFFRVNSIYNPVELAKALAGLIRILKKYRPVIVHSHLFFANILSRFAVAVHRRTVHIQTIHSPDYARENIHIYSSFRHFIEMVTLRLSRPKFISVSDYVKKESLKALKIGDSEVTTIYNYLNDDWFVPMLANRRFNKQIVSVGALYKQKGFEYLIRALRIVVDSGRMVDLAIAGDGPQKDELSVLIKKLDLKKYVSLVGRIDRVKDFISPADIFVFPSCNEGLGVALIEAMSQGKVCVATNVGAIPEIIDDGIDGFLVPAGNCEALARKIINIMDNYSGFSQMGEKARAKAESKFSKSRWVKRLSDYYAESIRENEKTLT